MIDLSRDGHPDGCRKALTQRAGRHVHADGFIHIGMRGQFRVRNIEGIKQTHREIPFERQGSVDRRTAMAFR